MRHHGVKFWQLLKSSFLKSMDDNAAKLAASLSYYTIFSLPPLLIIIIYLSGLFFGPEAVKGELFGQINGLVGNEAAIQIQETIKNVRLSNENVFAATLGVIMLMLGASGVFAEIQDSINYIWGLKAKPNKGLIKYLKNRIMSFSMIGSVGFLLLVGLIINSLMDGLSKRLVVLFPEDIVRMIYAVNLLLLFAIITILFMIIFKTLPDGKVAMKDALIGASFTAFLFMIGKFAIGFYLGNSKIATSYGVAGSVIVILLWVYYSALILYFGAEFTRTYAVRYGKKILPNIYAVFIEKEEVEIKPKVFNKEN
jgi:membrane protein